MSCTKNCHHIESLESVSCFCGKEAISPELLNNIKDLLQQAKEYRIELEAKETIESDMPISLQPLTS